MKRLLLLLIFSPVIVFGQVRRKAIVDSIKAATTDLQGVSTIISNNPLAKVEHINVSDSGEFVTLLIRIHVTEPIVIEALPPLAIAKIELRGIVTNRLNTIDVPPLPPTPIEPDTIMALSLVGAFALNTQGSPIAKVNAVTVPPLPPIAIEVDTILALPPIALSRINTQDMAVIKLAIIIVPPLPPVPIEADTITALSPVAVSRLHTHDITVAKLGTVIVPPLPPVPIGADTIMALSLASVYMLSTPAIPVIKVGEVIVPALPVIEEQTIEELQPYAAVELAIEHRYAGKMNTAAVPDLPETAMPITEMHLSEEGYALLEKMEGFSPELYSLKDGGFTIGFGFFIPYGEGKKWDKGVTWQQAERMIRQKVPTYEDQVKQYINVPLLQSEFDALTMMAYNLGGFSKATSIVNDINSNADFDKVQKDWMRFVHSKAPGVMKGLMNRRKDELDVRNESNYQPERKIQIFRSRK